MGHSLKLLRHRSSCELLEGRCLLSAVGFVTREIIKEVDSQFDMNAADMDGDGDIDVLSATLLDGKIFWHENTDGNGAFGPQRIIESEAGFISCPTRDFCPERIDFSAIASDIDGDGDMDVLSTASEIAIAWYENVDGEGTFGPRNLITTTPGDTVQTTTADIDGDGDNDIVIATRHEVVWYENTNGMGEFGPSQVIAAELTLLTSVFAADVDGDGDTDLLSANGLRDGEISWHENTDGMGRFGRHHVITSVDSRLLGVRAVDMDGDGDMDVLYNKVGPQPVIAWHENTDGAFGSQQVIANESAFTLHAVDLDSDGDIDLVSTTINRIAWYENTGGNVFTSEPAIIALGLLDEPTVLTAIPADIDGDGDIDVLSASFLFLDPSSPSVQKSRDKIGWYPHLNGTGAFGVRREIFRAVEAPDGPVSVFATDIDGDGDTDVLSASTLDDTIAWYENIDGKGLFGRPLLITTSAKGASSVYSADIDGDGDMDVLSAESGIIAWYENTDGKGTFGEASLVSTAASNPLFVYAADVDGDGDLDVLSGSGFSNLMFWVENTDGKGAFNALDRQEHLINTGRGQGTRSLFATDFDGDGDTDVLSVHESGEILLNENIDGNGRFWRSQLISNIFGDRGWAYLADVDNDGDMDVVAGSNSSGINWYENVGRVGPLLRFGTRLISNDFSSSLFVIDVDDDGDLDVTSASDGKVVWYENTDGKGTFGEQQVITAEADRASSIFAVDMDGDGDMDVLSASFIEDKVAWYENRIVGDADDNGKVEFADFLALSATFGTEVDAVWEDGDFNADGKVDFADFLILSANFGTTRP